MTWEHVEPEPEPPHKCLMPLSASTNKLPAVGSVWRCDECNTRYVVKEASVNTDGVPGKKKFLEKVRPNPAVRLPTGLGAKMYPPPVETDPEAFEYPQRGWISRWLQGER